MLLLALFAAVALLLATGGRGLPLSTPKPIIRQPARLKNTAQGRPYSTW